jgi:hypothetical protein
MAVDPSAHDTTTAMMLTLSAPGVGPQGGLTEQWSPRYQVVIPNQGQHSPDSSMMNASFPDAHTMHHIPASTEMYPTQSHQSFDVSMEDEGLDPVDSTASEKPAKGVSRATANNEREMRALFTANKHRALAQVASELHGNERGPNSERQRQVFAMLWCVSSHPTARRDTLRSKYVGLTPSQDKQSVLQGQRLGSKGARVCSLRIAVRHRENHGPESC